MAADNASIMIAFPYHGDAFGVETNTERANPALLPRWEIAYYLHCTIVALLYGRSLLL